VRGTTEFTNVRVLATSSPRHNHPSTDRARPSYRLVLRPEPHVADTTHAVRGALKVLLRRFGLRCISLEETHK
jgi:hypothetical protein